MLRDKQSRAKAAVEHVNNYSPGEQPDTEHSSGLEAVNEGTWFLLGFSLKERSWTFLPMHFLLWLPYTVILR